MAFIDKPTISDFTNATHTHTSNATGGAVFGVQGSQGNQGAAGAQGNQGYQGIQGTNGTIGVNGAQGAQGYQGANGSNGAQGNQGYQGAAGSNGAQGNQGAAGAQGNQGFQGAAGAQGSQGNQGTAGNGTIVFSEVPSGSINSSNTSFTTASSMVSNSLIVYLNGQRLTGGGVDFTQGAGTAFTMTIAPTTGDTLIVDYQTQTGTFTTGSTSFIYNETPSGTVNGSNTAFDTAFNYVAGTIQVYRDGQLMKGGGADYTETDANTITFTTAPVTGSVLLVTYQKSVSTAGNADTLDGLHGPTGAIVGTTDTQTITNKTISFANNTITTFPSNFMVINSGQQTLTSGAFRKVSFQTELFDDNNDFDSTTNYRFVAPTTGTYLFAAGLNSSAFTTRFILSLYVNNAEKVRFFDGNGTASTGSTVSGSAIIKLNATDYVEVFVYPVSSNMTVENSANGNSPYFCGYRIK